MHLPRSYRLYLDISSSYLQEITLNKEAGEPRIWAQLDSLELNRLRLTEYYDDQVDPVIYLQPDSLVDRMPTTSWKDYLRQIDVYARSHITEKIQLRNAE